MLQVSLGALHTSNHPTPQSTCNNGPGKAETLPPHPQEYQGCHCAAWGSQCLPHHTTQAQHLRCRIHYFSVARSPAFCFLPPALLGPACSSLLTSTLPHSLGDGVGGQGTLYSNRKEESYK